MSVDQLPALVLDASVILKWVLDAEDEPDRQAARDILERWQRGEVQLFVPTLWLYEVGNILSLKRPQDAAEALQALLALGLREIPLDGATSSRALELSQSYGITFYDASYLAAAGLQETVLITADSKLLRRLPAGAPARALGP